MKNVVMTYSRAIYRTNLKPRGVQGTDLLFKLFRARKGVVPQIDIALQGESEFAVSE